MTDVGYQALYSFVEDRYKQVLANLERIYQENLQAIAALRDLNTDISLAPASFRKQHGDLIGAVRETALKLGNSFTLQDIERHLRAEKPLLMLQTSRKSISTALRRLYEAHELVLIQEGRGTRPACYSVNTLLQGTTEGKEAHMGTVSGRQA